MPAKQRAHRKSDSLQHIKTQLLLHPEGYRISSLVEETGLHIGTVTRQLEELGARRVSRGVYALEPSPEDVALARAVLTRIEAAD